MEKNSKKTLIGCLVTILIIVGIVVGIPMGFKIYQENKANNLIGDLIANIDKYSEMKGEYVKGVPQKPTKYFIIQKDSGDTDSNKPYVYSPAYFYLPKELQAKSVEELNTLVRLDIYQSVTDKYEDGSLGYTEYADVTVFDMKTGNIIAKTMLSSGPPLQKVGPKESQHGRVDSLSITDYLKEIAGVN